MNVSSHCVQVNPAHRQTHANFQWLLLRTERDKNLRTDLRMYGFVRFSSNCSGKKKNQIYLPPLQTPFGSVDHPKPWPHGKTQASVAFASESRVLLLKTATAASLRTSGPRTSSLCPRLDETSEFVGAISNMNIDVLKFKNLLRTKLCIRMSRNSFALLTIQSVKKCGGKRTYVLFELMGAATLLSYTIYRLKAQFVEVVVAII